ncbi:hypothetical protein DPMN_106696 [Dreissena polymorpha]|uniref:Uncharacterized protein n=1 Tax=Dreissena polymorpha TaxID=45954 RepID=A0A9D4K5P7_DREPO|nr:hypothetical protein DPMN_106696 [Dreissena polymorpha]
MPMLSRIKNRDDTWPLGIFERRRSSPMRTRHPHGPNPAETCHQHGDNADMSRTVTTELCSYTTETRINTDQHGIYTDQSGPTRQRQGLTRHPYEPKPICAGPTITCIKAH